MDSTPEGVDAADVPDFERGDRLFVGDDGQRLESLNGQLLRGALVEQPAHPFVQLRTRHDLITAGHLDELQTRAALVVRSQRVHGGRDVFLRLVGEQLASIFGVIGSGEAKINASTIAFTWRRPRARDCRHIGGGVAPST